MFGLFKKKKYKPQPAKDLFRVVSYMDFDGQIVYSIEEDCRESRNSRPVWLKCNHNVASKNKFDSLDKAIDEMNRMVIEIERRRDVDRMISEYGKRVEA